MKLAKVVYLLLQDESERSNFFNEDKGRKCHECLISLGVNTNDLALCKFTMTLNAAFQYC